MGTARIPPPAKLVVGLLTARPELLTTTAGLLSGCFGAIDFTSQLLPFGHTRYYDAELGTPIWRQFVSFESLVEQSELAHVKTTTNALEKRLAEGGRRLVNMDPGYITAAKLVLATTKDHGHRIYVGEGIYAEVTLRFHAGSFEPWPWTYPDYASREYIDILNHVRSMYMQQLRALQAAR